MCERIAHAPLRPAALREMHHLYFAKGVVGTTAIEGNTLREDEVRAQLDGDLHVPPSKAYLQQETENIIRACNTIWRQVSEDDLPQLSAALIQDYNRRVLDRLDHLPDDVVPGEIPTHSVVVGTIYRGAPREDCAYLLDRLCGWLNPMGPSLWPEWPHPTEIPLAIIKAVLAHLYIAWIHPFGDGNGRTARLVEFLILADAGVPTPVAHLLSNHYNETRSEYYRQLHRASRSGGDPFPFLLYAVEGLVDGMRGQLDTIRAEQLAVAWESYVHETFRDRKRSPATARQRDLVLDLSRQTVATPPHAIPEITPRMARHYATKTTKTVTRDLNALLALDLIRKTPEGYVANTALMVTFTPFRRQRRGG